MALLGGSTALGGQNALYGGGSGPSGTLWTGLAQMSVSDKSPGDEPTTGEPMRGEPLRDKQPKRLTKLPSILFGGQTGDPNLAGLPNSIGTRELFIKMMVSVVLVVVLGGVAVYGSKRLAGKLANLPGKKIKIIETAHLGPRKAVHLLRIGDRCLLIGSTNDNITKLADLTTEIVMQEKALSPSGESPETGSSMDFGAGLEPGETLADLSTTYTEHH